MLSRPKGLILASLKSLISETTKLMVRRKVSRLVIFYPDVDVRSRLRVRDPDSRVNGIQKPC